MNMEAMEAWSESRNFSKCSHLLTRFLYELDNTIYTRAVVLSEYADSKKCSIWVGFRFYHCE